jgi:hypothetical protein
MKLRDFQRGLKNDLTDFNKKCKESSVTIDKKVDRKANTPIERPPGCPPY